MSTPFNIIAGIITWQRKTFGETYREEGLIAHIEKELAEIRTAPVKSSEWIDVIFLALHGYWASISMEISQSKVPPKLLVNALAQALWQKLQVNRQRLYPNAKEAGDVAVEHDRSKD